MANLGKQLKDWRVLTGLGVLVAGISSASILSRVLGIFIAGAVALAGLLALGARWLAQRLRSRRAREMEKGIFNLPTPALADGRASIQDLTRGFRESLERLSSAPELGADYLYRVPWYLMIGEPASGKTTTIRYSKLDIIGDKQRGIGGTLNCDWFFTNRGIILDTAGRYVYSEEGAPDRKEWEAFLSLLRRHRPRQPLNGVILVLPVVRSKDSRDIPLLLPGIEGGTDEELLARCARDAEKLYEKLSQLPAKLGVRFPVYLLITKCDKIPGFQEFFTQSSMEYQTQLLGWSNPEAETAYGPHMVDRAFEAVERSLDRARLEILARDMPLTFADEVFVFPEEFRRLKEPIRRYTDILFQRNIFQESLLFRGVFFSSGIQDRKPLEGLLGSLSKRPAVARLPAGAPAAEVGTSSMMGGSSSVAAGGDAPLFESRPYFIRDFYSEKVFPEANLVRPTRAHYQKAQRLTSILRAAALAVGTIGVVGFSFYIVKILHDSDRLVRAMDPIESELANLDRDSWTGLTLVEKHLNLASQAIQNAESVDSRVLRWLQIDAHTAEVEERAWGSVETLVLRLLARRFLEEFPRRVEGGLEKLDLSKPAPSLEEAELVKSLLPSWKREAELYLSIVRGKEPGRELPATERTQRLWALGAAKGKALPRELDSFLTVHGARPELAAALSRLPELDPALTRAREKLASKLQELDRAVPLKVESAILGLKRMGAGVAVLANAKETYEKRRDAIRELVVAYRSLPGDFLSAGAGTKTIESAFQADFEARAKDLSRVQAEAVPLAAGSSLVSDLAGAAGSILGGKGGEELKKAAGSGLPPAAISGLAAGLTPASGEKWKESQRWKDLEALLAGNELRWRGIDPKGPVFLLEMAAADPKAEGAAPKPAYAIAPAAREFLREVQYIAERMNVEGAGGGPAVTERLREEIQEKMELLLSGAFLADERHVKLIQRARDIVDRNRETGGGGARVIEPKPPQTSFLVAVVRELAQREILLAVKEALDAPPPAADSPAAGADGKGLAFGSDVEAAFLAPVEGVDLLPADAPERELVERIQVRHALNRLRRMRTELLSSDIFLLDEEKVRSWDFATRAESVNLVELLHSPVSVLDDYSEIQMKKLLSIYANRFARGKYRELLEKRAPDGQREDVDFWRETADEAKREEGKREGDAQKAQERRAQLKELVRSVLALRTDDNAPFDTLAKFIENENAKRSEHREGRSFLDTRYVAIERAVEARIRRFLAQNFEKEFEGFAGGVFAAVHDRFPVSFTQATSDPYKPLGDELKRAEAFFRKWGLGELPPGGSQRRLAELTVKEFQDGAGVDLAEAYRKLLAFVKGNFHQGKYQLQVRLQNFDAAFKNSLEGSARLALDGANANLREFYLRSGEVDQRLEKDRTAEVGWVNPLPVALRVRLTANEDKYRIRKPGAPQPAIEAVYEFPGGPANQWALFRAILDRKESLAPEGNLLRFDFEVVPEIAVRGEKVRSLPVYLLLQIKGTEKEALPARFDHDELERLYGKIVDPDLKLR